MRKGMDEYNKLKAEEMKRKAFNAYNNTQTYKNEWSLLIISHSSIVWTVLFQRIFF